MKRFRFLSALVVGLSSAASAGQLAVEGEVLVRARAGRLQDVHAALAARGLPVLQTDRFSGVMRVRVDQGREEATIAELSALNEFAYAERNGVCFVGGEPNDTFFHLQWHLRNTGQSGGLVGADIDVMRAWNVTTGSPSIGIAVIDTGIMFDHPEFAGRIAPNGWDFIEDDGVPQAEHPHGTQVSGCIAANANNDFAVTGVDWACAIIPIKMFDAQGEGTNFNLAQSLNYCATQRNVQVVSMSIINASCGATLVDALQNARDAGKILVACAGNLGIGDADVSCPGASPLTISVGWTNRFDARNLFSATGNALDFVAPGTQIVTTAQSLTDTTASVNGCSFATPITAGVVALLLARAQALGVTLDHDRVYELLRRGAEDEVGPPWEDAPGWDAYFGHGRVNAYRSLLALGADLNGDGIVDGTDLMALLGSWGPCAACATDIDNDGQVDGADLATLLGQWG